TPSRRRPVVCYWHDTYRVSERRACRVARLPVSTFRYESRQEPRTALRLRIREIATTRVRYGCRKIHESRSVWTSGTKTGGPQSWNMYAYARNNPLIFIDPRLAICGVSERSWKIRRFG